MLFPVIAVRLLEKLTQWIGTAQARPILGFLVFLNFLLWTYSYLDQCETGKQPGSDRAIATWTMTDVDIVTQELMARGYTYPRHPTQRTNP